MGWSGRAPAPPARQAGKGRQRVLPAIRALARKLEVDLNLVQATGPGGTITRADVERAAKSQAEAGPAESLRGMRRAMAIVAELEHIRANFEHFRRT